MRVTTAQLPEAANSDDKVFTTPNAVIMLDGASAFTPVPVSASVYTEHLGRHLRDELTAAPEHDLQEVLAHAIRASAGELKLTPGHSPSSTVTVVRDLADALEVLILGDNLVIMPNDIITDNRLDRLDLAPRRTYRDRLAAGFGYDDEHRAVLRELQAEQAKWRNREGGYWIAEAEPAAAAHAIVRGCPITAAPWAVLATDGAYHTMLHLGLTDWPMLVKTDTRQLAGVLHRCDRWEADTDPSGVRLPRAKRHDDKSLATVSFPARRLRHINVG
jgi:hypothetical protein